MSLRDLAYKIAQEEGINPDLFVRQIEVESAFNPQAKSSAGAMGLAQLMPATAKDLGVTNPYDPEQSLRGGARYMKQLLGRYNNNQTLAHAAYNAGMGNVDKAGGVPNFKETQNYIAKILGGNSMIGAQAPQQMAQQEKPRGLLGGMIDRDFADQLYMAALAGSPNAQRFQPLIQQVAADRERRVERKDAQAKANVTASYLDSIGQENLGKLVREGGITGAEAIKVATSEGKNFKDIERYKLAQSQGYKGTYLDFEADLAKIEQTGEVPAGLKAMNEKFGEEFLDIDLVGLGEARNRAAKIKTVLDKLEAGEQLTGPLLGLAGEFGRSVFAPESQQAKDLVESVVQTSLREILGGQFAQQEGKELIKRSYNINLPPEQNAARLRALFAQLDAAAEAKSGMAKYFKENNFSLAGYEGSKYTPSRADLEAAMDAAVVTDSPDTKAAPAVQPVVINGYKIEKIQ